MMAETYVVSCTCAAGGGWDYSRRGPQYRLFEYVKCGPWYSGFPPPEIDDPPGWPVDPEIPPDDPCLQVLESYGQGDLPPDANEDRGACELCCIQIADAYGADKIKLPGGGTARIPEFDQARCAMCCREGLWAWFTGRSDDPETDSLCGDGYLDDLYGYLTGTYYERWW
jgi:hypothetical protein